MSGVKDGDFYKVLFVKDNWHIIIDNPVRDSMPICVLHVNCRLRRNGWNYCVTNRPIDQRNCSECGEEFPEKIIKMLRLFV